jgi:hypothetical protein
MRAARDRLLRALVVLALSSALLGAPLSARDNTLADYEWSHRPLLVFAPHRSDPRVEAVLHRLAMRDCELRDREIIVALLVEQGQSRMGADLLTPDAAQAVRERFEVDPRSFTVILVGKDGGEKRRDTELPDLDAVFAQIDGMPMRRDEMLARQDPCEE